MYCIVDIYCYTGEADFVKWLFDLLLRGSECSLLLQYEMLLLVL